MTSIRLHINSAHRTLRPHTPETRSRQPNDSRDHDPLSKSQLETQQGSHGAGPSNSRPNHSLIFTTGIAALSIGFSLLYIGNFSGLPTTETTHIAQSPAKPPTIYTLSSSLPNNLPSEIASLKYSTRPSANSPIKVTSPSWSPYPNSAGSVKRSGDIAVIDASHSLQNINLQVEVENMHLLSSNYSAFSFPIDIYSCNPSRGRCGTSVNHWTPYETAQTYNQHFVSNSSPIMVTSLTHGFLYDITLDAGQGFYRTTSIPDPSSAGLSPSFFISTRAN